MLTDGPTAEADIAADRAARIPAAGGIASVIGRGVSANIDAIDTYTDVYIYLPC